MTKKITVEVSDEIWETIKITADKEDRTVTQQARRVLRLWATGEVEPEQLKLPPELMPKIYGRVVEDRAKEMAAETERDILYTTTEGSS